MFALVDCWRVARGGEGGGLAGGLLCVSFRFRLAGRPLFASPTGPRRYVEADTLRRLLMRRSPRQISAARLVLRSALQTG